jgi:hypothetical protein
MATERASVRHATVEGNHCEEDVNIVLEVRDNEHSRMSPIDRGNDPMVESDETERFDSYRGTWNGELQS